MVLAKIGDMINIIHWNKTAVTVCFDWFVAHFQYIWLTLLLALSTIAFCQTFWSFYFQANPDAINGPSSLKFSKCKSSR